MTKDRLEDQHIQAVRDVLTGAMLAIEEPVYEALSPRSRNAGKKRVG